MEKKYDKEELDVGQVIEEEHKPTYEMIKKTLEETGELPSPEEVYDHIAKDHLDEYDNYYTGLVQMEEELKEQESDMEEVEEGTEEEETEEEPNFEEDIEETAEMVYSSNDQLKALETAIAQWRKKFEKAKSETEKEIALEYIYELESELEFAKQQSGIHASLVKKYREEKDRKEWALVSKSDNSKVLKWFGTEKPSDEAVEKEERRVQYFKNKG